MSHALHIVYHISAMVSKCPLLFVGIAQKLQEKFVFCKAPITDTGLVSKGHKHVELHLLHVVEVDFEGGVVWRLGRPYYSPWASPSGSFWK